MNLRIAISGMGRIGRGTLRAKYARDAARRLEIVAIRDVMPIQQVAYLIRHDSIYGRFAAEIDVDGDDIVINGDRIRYFQVDLHKKAAFLAAHEALRPHGVDVMVDATGRSSAGDLRSLVSAGLVRKVLTTWNVPGLDISVVFGVNHENYQDGRHVLVAASTCTGNALAPVMLVLEKHLGVRHGRVLTLHPVLSDQRVLDAPHETAHLGRMASASIVPSNTKVVESTTMVLPSLEGKLDSLSYRLPTTCVSALDLTVALERPTTVEEVTGLLDSYAGSSLAGILACDRGSWGREKVSIDFLGHSESAIVLMSHLRVLGRTQIGMSIMHDNEWGYCCRVLDVLGLMRGR